MADTKMDGKDKLKCLIADSAGFLKNVDLQNLAEQIFTISDVVAEIKDANTRQRLAILPYDIMFREPSIESIQFITQFSKKTGDFKSLSAVDIRVLALTYQLEKEFGCPENIRTEPTKKDMYIFTILASMATLVPGHMQHINKTEIVGKTKVHFDKNIAGFYTKQKNVANNNESQQQIEGEGGKATRSELTIDSTISKEDGQNLMQVDSTKEDDQTNDERDMINPNNESNDEQNDETREGFEDRDDDEDDIADENEEDDDGWITPGNIKKVVQEMGVNNEISIGNSNIQCACLTTDFAMQNVLIQMGLHVLSVQGMLIRQARNFIQKCFGCNKETHDMGRIFCPSCGNKTLMKISITINDDGTVQYHLPRRKKNFNIRGTKYALSAPKGGRHSEQPLLTEDQRANQNRLPKKKDLINPLDPDFNSRSNPFAQNDVNSRAFHLNLHVKARQTRNPNETKKKKSSRKKR